MAEFLLREIVAVISLKCTVYSKPGLFYSCELLYSMYSETRLCDADQWEAKACQNLSKSQTA